MRSHRRSSVAAATLLAVALTMSAASAAPRPDDPAPPSPTAADLPPGAVVTDGEVRHLLRHGDTIYAVGDFDTVGRYAGPGALLDASTGAPVATDQIHDGQISVIVGDGSGGWYLGGDFSRIGDHELGGLAHVHADGTLDPDFAPRVGGLVSALALVGDTLYFGGDFNTVDDADRQKVAAVSADDGALLPFDAPQSTERVTELAYAPADGERSARLFVGSEHLVAVDPVTGAAVPGYTALMGGPHPIRALLVSGDRLLVGTDRLLAYDAATGAVDDGFESALPIQEGRAVHALLDTGSRLYVGTDLKGADRLVALDPETGARQSGFDAELTGSTAAFGGPGGVYDLALDGDRLWVAGAFTMDRPEGGLTVLDAESGAPSELVVPAYHRQVNAVEVSDGQAYVGGMFYLADPVHTRDVAALDAATLEPRAGFAALGAPWGEPIASTKALYVGEQHFHGYRPGKAAAASRDFFYSYRYRLDAFDLETGEPLLRQSKRIKRMTGLTTIGGRVYVAQRLEDDRRFPRNRILVFNAVGKRVDTLRVPVRGYITTMDSIGGNLLLGGSFKRRTPTSWPPATPILRLDAKTGKRDTSFHVMVDGAVYDLAVQGKAIYASGLFTRGYVDAPVFDHVKLPGVVRVNGRSRITPGFAPGAHSAIPTLLRVVPLADMLWLQGAKSFIDRRTGATLADPTGDPRWIQGMAPADPGRAWTSWFHLHVGGHGTLKLGYVAASAG